MLCRSDLSSDEQCDHVTGVTAQHIEEPPSKLPSRRNLDCDSSPLPPSPESLSPQLEQSRYGSTTYRYSPRVLVRC